MKKNLKLFDPGVQHIVNFENYYDTKKKTIHDPQRLEDLRKFHEDNEITRVYYTDKSYRYPYDFDHVGVKLKVRGGGDVKVTVCQPFHILYDNYQSRGVQPPLSEKVKLMNFAGYPDYVLEKIIKKYN